MDKEALFRGTSRDGSPLIHRVEPGSAHGASETGGLCKTASGEHLPEVLELLESIEAQPGRLYLVNSALGAGEYVGFNLRGDWFTEAGLRRAPPGFEDIPVWDIDARRRAANQTEALPRWGSLTWGYPTFYNAHRFRHHVNKDPNKAYGFILGAFWDDRMKRVILVSELVRDMCAKMGALDLYDRIRNGEFPDTSMGSKVPYDRCSICDNHARTPLEYCKHVQRGAPAPYGMKTLLPDGRICGVYNDYPRFFDDSYVFVGAERSAKVMSNVTDQVLGSNGYSQTIYPFIPPRMRKTAGAEEPAAAPMPDFVIEEKLTRALGSIPASTPMEREALRFFMQERLAEERLLIGTMSATEFEMWKEIAVNTFSRQYGLPPHHLSHLKDVFNQRVNLSGVTKVAEMPKWAEMLKRIPAPTAAQMSLLRKEEQSLPELPREVLDQMAESPGPNLRAAARLGIVVRPHEFQRILLSRKNPALADELYQNREVFRPCALKSQASPFDAASFVPQEAMSRIISLLTDFLPKRSFAPSAIRIRLVRGPTEDSFSPLRERAGLDHISRLYNAYRLGIITKKPDLQAIRVPGGYSRDLRSDVKTAEDAVELSNILLHVAYWPGLALGLSQPAEGRPPEDASQSHEPDPESTHVPPYGA
jgi:hypothetical protein